MSLRGHTAAVINVTDDPMWNHFLERVAIADAHGRRSKDEPLSLTHDDQFWAFAEPVRIYRVVEWM